MEQLIQVKGIGRWTAQMFLIFWLGRPDVFPHDDLGVRTAIRDHYGLADLPDKATSLAIATPWRPYASVASWYCWRSLDLARNTDTVAKGYHHHQFDAIFLAGIPDVKGSLPHG